MKKFLSQVALLFLFSLCFTLPAFAQTTTGTLEHDGETRDYRIHLPPDFDNSESLPLVFNFHGFTSNAIAQEFYSGMNTVADSANFIVCYPNGIGAAWNVGWAFGSTADDIGFVEAMIEEFADLYNINTSRVYSCGMSNGGFMSYHLACNIPDKIAAIASVTGSMVPGSFDTCQPEIARPILEIHGTADPTVAYNGTAGISEPIESVVAHWVSLNNCEMGSDTTAFADINTNDGSTAIRVDYNSCDSDNQISLIKISGGGHTWPGSEVIIGPTNQDFNASATIWNFFNRFSSDQTTATGDLSATAAAVTLFPNPAHHVLHISYDTADGSATPVSFEIFGINGQQISGLLEGNQNSISISTLPKGMYIFRIAGKDDSAQKFIKQ